MRPIMTVVSNNLRRTALGLLFTALAVGPVAGQQGAPNQESSRVVHVAFTGNPAPQHLLLPLDKGVVIETERDVRDVYAASPGIVDAVVRDPRHVFLMSQKLGQTNVILLDAQGKQVTTVELNIVPDVAVLNDQIAREMPGTRVRAEALNDSIVLSGSVNNIQEASRAQDMAQK